MKLKRTTMGYTADINGKTVTIENCGEFNRLHAGTHTHWQAFEGDCRVAYAPTLRELKERLLRWL